MMARGIEKRLEAMEKHIKTHDPKAAEKQAEAEAAVQAILRSPQEPSPPDPEAWREAAIATAPWKQRFVSATGMPVWKNDGWDWPEFGAPDYRSWSGAVSHPSPVYFKS